MSSALLEFTGLAVMALLVVAAAVVSAVMAHRLVDDLLEDERARWRAEGRERRQAAFDRQIEQTVPLLTADRGDGR